MADPLGRDARDGRARLKTQPFLKWPGGKRWLAPTLVGLLGPAEGRYFEPFLGSGAVFFRLQPADAQLSDSNPDLVDAFVAVRDDVQALVDALSQLTVDPETFRLVRARPPVSALGRAVRLVYLNRTAFNGLWRVNQKGEFNVPFGCKPGTTAVDAANLIQCSYFLQGADIRCSDFRPRLAEASKDDIVYIDPPYTVTHNRNGFRRYNERIFSWSDQLDLACAATELASKGCRVIVTNAVHPEVARLYDRRLFVRYEVDRHSRMAADPAYRRVAAELLIVSRTSIPRGVDISRRFASAGIQANRI